MVKLFDTPGWTSGTFNGVKHRYLSIKPDEGKDWALLLHGWPTGPLCYRSMVPLLRAQGYGVLLPECIGYGETDKPEDLKVYSRKHIADHVVAILDHEKIDKVILVGHDWGSPVGQRLAAWYPERVKVVILVTMPYDPPTGRPFPIDERNARFKSVLGYDPYGYQKFLMKPTAAQTISDNLESFMSIVCFPGTPAIGPFLSREGDLELALPAGMSAPKGPWVTQEQEEEIREYLSNRETVKHALYWYNANVSNINDEFEKDLPRRLKHPYLFIESAVDAIFPPVANAEQEPFCDNITVKQFPAGHWVMDSHAEGVATAMVEWLEDQGL